MKHLMIILFILSGAAAAQETVEFPAADGLEVTADFYPAARDDIVIVAFHQAGSSRGEYRDTAQRLTSRGIPVLAVDQRSGGRFLTIENETNRRAIDQGLGQNYLDALPDMRAALAYARERTGARFVIALGSSYSASLSIVLAGTDSELVDAVIAFSPGEYFQGRQSVAAEAARVEQPILITSAASEIDQWKEIFDTLPREDRKDAFRPSTGRGAHGASALISRRSDIADDYWDWVDYFLDKHFPYFGPPLDQTP